MDLTQQLRHKVLVERVGYAFFVELDYENLPAFCSHCRCIGHFVDNCRKIVGNDKDQGVLDAPGKKKSGKEQSKVYVQTADKRIEQNRVNVVDPTTSNPIDVAHNIVVDTTVLPDKVNSNTPLEVGLDIDVDKDIDKGVNLPIANRFAGLQQDNQNVSPIIHDEVVTVESDSSLESEFVETTPIPLPKDTVEPVLTLNADIPPRVQHDMVFLKESWANMQEQEEAEAKYLAEVEASEVGLAAHQQESSFQMVTSKNKKKKSKSPVKKATYDTRSKVGNSRPFR
jgi:hypothetical protein